MPPPGPPPTGRARVDKGGPPDNAQTLLGLRLLVHDLLAAHRHSHAAGAASPSSRSARRPSGQPGRSHTEGEVTLPVSNAARTPRAPALRGAGPAHCRGAAKPLYSHAPWLASALWLASAPPTLPLSNGVYPHVPWLAGVWGEASPQVPPEARLNVGPAARVRGTS